MAPELTLGLNYDFSVDVFAFGILSFILITGNFSPYKTSKELVPMSVQLKVASDELYRPDLSEIKENDWLQDLCAACWGNDSEARLSFADILEVLKGGNQHALSAVMKTTSSQGKLSKESLNTIMADPVDTSPLNLEAAGLLKSMEETLTLLQSVGGLNEDGVKEASRLHDHFKALSNVLSA